MRINDYAVLRNHQCSLQETSKDTSDNTVHFMTICRKKVVNFDAVKTEYMNRLGMSEEKASSVDAFVMEQSNYLIEFKNGDARAEQHKIFQKAKDSLFILNSILNRQIEDSRRSDTFILVYNKDKTALSDKERRAKTLAQKGRTNFVLFGLDKMEGFCYKKVMTLDQKQFEEVIQALRWV